MKLIVKDIVGVNGISMQSGDLLYRKIIEPLKSGDKVELDFVDLKLFATPFFNASIGLTLRDIEISALQERLTFINLTPFGLQLVNHVIKNAIDFYKNESGISDALNSINLDPEQ